MQRLLRNADIFKLMRFPGWKKEGAQRRAGYKYWAFLSYSHEDNVGTRSDGSDDHMRWADWLHAELEMFQVPGDYRKLPTRTGDPMPERFFPAFRDEAELAASHDLGGQIRQALEHSRFLIVIASPRSARSRYVNEEVRYFRQLGRGDRILTFIVDGEPNAPLAPADGGMAAFNCFCPALLHPLRRNGTVDNARLLAEVPLCADVRVKDAGKRRELRCSESDQPDCVKMLEFMKLKLFAGIMGVGLDELVQRDQIRAREEFRKEEARCEEKRKLSTDLQAAQSFQHRHQLELRSAHKIQQRFFPASVPDVAGYKISGINVPAGTVSGGYFDFLAIDNEHYGVLVANISSKGLPASLIMATCRAVVRTVARSQLSPADMLQAVNAQLYPDIKDDMFISMTYVILKSGSCELTLCHAGHDAPLLYRAQDHVVSQIAAPCLALGTDEGAVFNRVNADLRLELAADDCLLLYTDGVTEALDLNGGQFGLPRLIECMMHKDKGGNFPPALIARLVEDLDKFIGKAPQNDDITFVAIQKT